MRQEQTKDGNLAFGWGDFFFVHFSFRCFWMRIFGLGISFRDISRRGLLFTERNGYVWGWQFCKYYFKFLGRY